MVSWQQSIGTSSVLPWIQISPFCWPLQFPRWTKFLSLEMKIQMFVIRLLVDLLSLVLHVCLGCAYLSHEKDEGQLGPLQEKLEQRDLFKATSVRWPLRHLEIHYLRNRTGWLLPLRSSWGLWPCAGYSVSQVTEPERSFCFEGVNTKVKARPNWSQQQKSPSL